jgi:LysM repeat protein
MSKKSTWILILCLAAMVFLVSCQRSASQSPVVISTATHAAGLATQPANGLGSVQIIGTQTAMALAKLSGTATPNGAVALPTSTPFGTPAVPTTSSLIPPTGAAPTTIGISTTIPGTTPVILVPTSTPGHPSTYTLMQGDYPYCIARRFNVNQQELLDLNGITTGQGMQPGTVLRIPQTSNPFVGLRTLRNHPTTYTVTTAAETIYGVACTFGDVDPNQIIAANSLASPYTLHINQVLNIP